MDTIALLSKIAENGIYATIAVLALAGMYWIFVLYKESQEARIQAEKEHAKDYKEMEVKDAEFKVELKNTMASILDFVKVLVNK